MLTFVLQALEGHAKSTPDRCAIEIDSQRMSYRSLWLRCIRRAHELAHARIGRGARVALSLGRSVEHIECLLAVWLLGASFTVISEHESPERTAVMLNALNVDLVLARRPKPEGLETTRWAEIERALDHRIGCELSNETAGPIDARDEAYVLFSSGTTQLPKAISVGHQGLAHVLASQCRLLSLSPHDRVLWMLAEVFDAHLSDVLTTLCAGATLVIDRRTTAQIAAQWPSVLHEHRVTVCDVPPSVLRRYRPASLPQTLRALIVGGEPSEPELLRDFGQRLLVLSAYGPTECTLCTHMRAVDARWCEPMIGDALDDVRERVEPLDSSGEGELWISGPGVAREYVGQPELTAQRFVTDSAGVRWFRTGDRVRPSPNGWVYVGRLDRQCKVRGVLVAPEQIEAAFEADERVLGASAFVRRAHPNDDELVVVVQAQISSPMRAAIVADARRRVSVQVWPSAVIWTDALPRSPSGKVAHGEVARLFAANSQRLYDGSDDSPLRLATLSGLMATLLDVPAVGEDESFFDAGADSLHALQLMRALAERGAWLSPSTLYEHPTPRALFAAWQSSRGHDRVTLSELAPPRDLALSMDSQAKSLAEPRVTHVLLTGATGLVGSQTLRWLLDHTEVHVTTIVRATDRTHARARVEAALGRHASGSKMHARWEAYSLQNITQNEPMIWRSAVDEGVGRAVIHAAGAVQLMAPRSALLDANVTQAEHALALLGSTPNGRMVHVSTLSVAAASACAPGVFGDGLAWERLGALEGGYAQSKWLAELALVRACDRSGQSLTIVRPGLVVGRSDSGDSHGTDQFARVTRAVRAIGVVPQGLYERRETLRMDLLPVEVLAAALGLLATGARPSPGCFVMADAQGATMAQWLEALGREGSAIEPVETRVFVRELREAQHRLGLDADVAFASVVSPDEGLWRAGSIFASTHWAWKSPAMGALLRDASCTWPAVTPALFDRLVRAALAPIDSLQTQGSLRR
ncbi:MAG: AMP-binding protein [Deltaproteobacteria bacterium]|nr:AMP-binding protein [Deltaproteobacteria bacterium]